QPIISELIRKYSTCLLRLLCELLSWGSDLIFKTMKNIRIQLNLTVLSIVIVMQSTSCSKLVEVNSPANAVDSKILFSTESGYESAIRGIYQNMLMLNLGLANGGLSLYMSLAADDLIPRSTGANYQAFYQNSLLSSNSVVSGFWALSYEGIYRANILLENLESSDVLNSEKAADIKGQALFVRAFYYFYLWQLYGDVPLVLDTDYRKNAIMSRTDEQLVADQIIADLRLAAQLISKEGREDKAMPDYYAVHALLARVNLYVGDYESAEDAC